MDKVQKIREEVVRMHNLLPVVDGDNIYLNYADRICTTLEMYIDSLQEEPKFKVGQYLKQGDTIVKILEVSDDGYHCDNAFVPFTAQDSWNLVEEPASEELGEAAKQYEEDAIFYAGRNISEFFKAGAQWQKEQMMAKAVDWEVTYGKSLAIPSLGWVLDKEGLDFGDKVKLVIIKED